MSEHELDSRARAGTVPRRLDSVALGQLLLGVAAILISAAALYATFLQTKATVQMQEASVLPAIQLDLIINDAIDERSAVTVRVQNMGVGPATVRHWRLLVDGVDASPSALRQRLPAIADPREFAPSSMQNRMLAPGVTFDPLRFDTAGDAGPKAALVEALRAGRPTIAMEICYCSIYEQCWTAIQIVGKDNRRPARDDACALRLQPADLVAAGSPAPVAPWSP